MFKRCAGGRHNGRLAHVATIIKSFPPRPHHIVPESQVKTAIVASRWIQDVLFNVPAGRSLWNKEFGKLQKARMLEDVFTSFLPTGTHLVCLEPFERHTCDSVKIPDKGERPEGKRKDLYLFLEAPLSEKLPHPRTIDCISPLDHQHPVETQSSQHNTSADRKKELEASRRHGIGAPDTKDENRRYPKYCADGDGEKDENGSAVARPANIDQVHHQHR